MTAPMTSVNMPSEDWRAYRGVLWRRAMAFIVDYVLIAILVIPAAVLVFFLGLLTLGLGFYLFPVLYFVVAALYFGLTVGGAAQASPGMRMMGLQIARMDGQPLDFMTAMIHLVLFWIGNAVLTPLVLLVGLFTDRGRLLHDFLIGTVTVRRDIY
jgi:uncharacterized RDD family membrane protein YckC